MLLLRNGVSDHNVILAFAVIYVLALAPLYFNNFVQITKTTLLLSSVMIIIVSFHHQNLVAFPLVVFAASMQLARDIMFSEVIDVYSRLSQSKHMDIKKIIAFAMTIGMFASCLFMPMVGLISSLSTTACYLLIGTSGVYVACNLTPSRDHNQSYAMDRVKRTSSSEFKYFCAHSFAIVMCRYFIRFFTLPLLILDMSNRLGVGSYSFTIIASVASLVSVASFIFTPQDETGVNQYGLYKSLFATLSVSMFIAIISVCSSNIPTILFGITIVISYFLLEYTSKRFSVYQAAELRDLADKEQSRDHAYATFIKYRVFGGFIGFIIAYALYKEINDSLGAFIVCCSLSISALLFIKQFICNRPR